MTLGRGWLFHLRGPRLRAGCRGALYTECRVGAKTSPKLLFLAPTLAPHLQRNLPSNRSSVPSLYAFAARSWYSSGSMGYWHSSLIFIPADSGPRTRRPFGFRFGFPKMMRRRTVGTSHQNRTATHGRRQGESSDAPGLALFEGLWCLVRHVSAREMLGE